MCKQNICFEGREALINRPNNIARRLLPLPSIFAKPFARPTDRESIQILSKEEQIKIVEISQIVEMRRNTVIYPEGGQADFVYNIVSGVVETYNLLPNGERRITSFLFQSDLLGLSESGKYAGTAQAVTAIIAYKMPYNTLEELMRRDPKIDVVLLCKLCHELRRSERHMITVSRRDARARVASFILWLWRSEVSSFTNDTVVKFPMLRHDIADYLGITKESVSRTLLQLETDRLIQREGPRALRLLDIPRLQQIAGAS